MACGVWYCVMCIPPVWTVLICWSLSTWIVWVTTWYHSDNRLRDVQMSIYIKGCSWCLTPILSWLCDLFVFFVLWCIFCVWAIVSMPVFVNAVNVGSCVNLLPSRPLIKYFHFIAVNLIFFLCVYGLHMWETICCTLYTITVYFAILTLFIIIFVVHTLTLHLNYNFTAFVKIVA